MLTDRQVLGLKGERIAARWLRSRGWHVLAERYRSGHRDIDLIITRADAFTGGRLVAFVEVRTKLSTDWGTPIETIHREKQRLIAFTARDWICKNKRSNDTYRFDVVGVIVSGQNVRIQYIPDAFWR